MYCKIMRTVLNRDVLDFNVTSTRNGVDSITIALWTVQGESRTRVLKDSDPVASRNGQ